MSVIYRFQDMVEIMYNDVSTLETNANDTQRVAHQNHRKKDEKAFFLIDQCVDPNVF